MIKSLVAAFGHVASWSVLFALLLFGLLMVKTRAGASSQDLSIANGNITAPADALTLATDQEKLPTDDGQAHLTATLLDTAGQPVSGAVVLLSTSLGEVTPTSITTDANGEATAVLNAGPLPGIATVTAQSGQYSTSVNIFIETPRPDHLSLQVDTLLLKPSDQTQLVATVQDQFDRPMAGELIVLFGSYGFISPDSQISDINGQVAAMFTVGDRPGEGTITALSGSLADSVNISIIDPDQGSNRVFLPSLQR